MKPGTVHIDTAVPNGEQMWPLCCHQLRDDSETGAHPFYPCAEQLPQLDRSAALTDNAVIHGVQRGFRRYLS